MSTPVAGAGITVEDTALSESTVALLSILETGKAAILQDWLQYQLKADTRRADLIKEGELREQSQQFLDAFVEALASGADVNAPAWGEVRGLLESVSRSRAIQGFTPSETAVFVFSLKQPLFEQVRKATADEGRAAALAWEAGVLLDKLGLFTTEAYQQGREQVIQRQQQELLDLSTPVVRLYDSILALPLIGTLDSERTQVVMENLLQGIVENEASIAIIDITGVPTVDTLVAQHLLKTVAAARLMGAECIISGIRPQIAQTIVHLGVDLGNVITRATLAEAFRMALAKRGLAVGKRARSEPAPTQGLIGERG